MSTPSEAVAADVAAPALDTPLSRVAMAWLAEHGGEPARLDEAKIWEIAWRLVQARIQPTYDNVRAVNSGGSPNVIHPALKSFFREKLHEWWKTPAPLPEVPAAVMALWSTAIDSAREVTEQALSKERTALTDRSAALNAAGEDLRAREAALDERQLALSAQMRLLEKAAALAQEDKQRAEVESAALREQLAETLALLQASDADLRASRTTSERLPLMEADRDRLRDDVQREQQRVLELVASRDDLAGQVRRHLDSIDRARAVESTLREELDAARVELAHTRASLDAQRLQQQATDSALRQANAELVADRERADQLVQALESQRQATSRQAQELAALSFEREGLLQEVAALRAEANHMSRIEAALATLSQAKHAPDEGASDGGALR